MRPFAKLRWTLGYFHIALVDTLERNNCSVQLATGTFNTKTGSIYHANSDRVKTRSHKQRRVVTKLAR